MIPKTRGTAMLDCGGLRATGATISLSLRIRRRWSVQNASDELRRTSEPKRGGSCMSRSRGRETISLFHSHGHCPTNPDPETGGSTRSEKDSTSQAVKLGRTRSIRTRCRSTSASTMSHFRPRGRTRPRLVTTTSPSIHRVIRILTRGCHGSSTRVQCTPHGRSGRTGTQPPPRECPAHRS